MVVAVLTATRSNITLPPEILFNNFPVKGTVVWYYKQLQLAEGSLQNLPTHVEPLYSIVLFAELILFALVVLGNHPIG